MQPSEIQQLTIVIDLKLKAVHFEHDTKIVTYECNKCGNPDLVKNWPHQKNKQKYRCNERLLRHAEPLSQIHSRT